MSARSLQRRLHSTRRRVCDQTYKRLARLIIGPVRPEDERHIAQLFTFLMDTERELGTPVETVVASNCRTNSRRWCQLPRGWYWTSDTRPASDKGQDNHGVNDGRNCVSAQRLAANAARASLHIAPTYRRAICTRS
jgi:hypothetical protein